jgi:hypothetical protein
MSSPARLERLATLHLAVAMLLLVMAPAQAQDVPARLFMSAEAVIVCELKANVPRVGTIERRSGGASFDVKCNRGASAAAMACGNPCDPSHIANAARNEQQVSPPRGDGTTVATLLF